MHGHDHTAGWHLGAAEARTRVRSQPAPSAGQGGSTSPAVATGTDAQPRAPANTSGGFTLVEVMVAATLSTLILGGVLSAFLFIGRTSYSARGYSEMEAQIRRGLDTFASDARMASGIQWNSSQSITFILPTATSATTKVTYAYDSASTGDTAQCFYRLPGSPSSAAARRVLVRNVDSDFSFARYKLEQDGVTDNTAANDLETKLIQINLHVARTAVTVGTTSQTSRSARYLLRNKRVTN